MKEGENLYGLNFYYKRFTVMLTALDPLQEGVKLLQQNQINSGCWACSPRSPCSSPAAESQRKALEAQLFV